MNGAFPVEGPRIEIFLRRMAGRIAPDRVVDAPSYRASLVSFLHERRIRLVPQFTPNTTRADVADDVHRFEESIGGRSYLIEVANVTRDRWRAQIVRLPGVPTALMPFYGATPDDAASQLRQWLTRAHQRANGGSRRV